MSRLSRLLASTGGMRIVMYHSIADNPNDPHAVAPAEFARQIEELVRSGCDVIDLPEALQDLRSGNYPGKVVLTFDDAYEDFLLNAVPILKKHNLPATVFAPTGLIGKTAIWDTHDKSKLLMNWEQLKEIHRLGFGVGSHTVSHPNLIRCDAHQLAHELEYSLDILQQRLDKVTPVLSYPGGHFTKRERKAAQQAGYSAAVGVASHWANYPWTNRFNLRRCRWNT